MGIVYWPEHTKKDLASVVVHNVILQQWGCEHATEAEQHHATIAMMYICKH